jgi:hypothetical protein
VADRNRSGAAGRRHRRPTDFARIGMMQALYPPGAPVDTDRKDRPWSRRRLARDR